MVLFKLTFVSIQVFNSIYVSIQSAVVETMCALFILCNTLCNCYINVQFSKSLKCPCSTKDLEKTITSHNCGILQCITWSKLIGSFISCIPCLWKKNKNLNREMEASLFLVRRKYIWPSKVSCPCVYAASALLLLIPPVWKHMAPLQCGSCWTSTYCILSQKDWW